MKASQKFMITLSDIQEARQELKKFLTPSPLILNRWLSDYFKCEVYLKMENMQPIGSFKIRGATYKIMKLNKKERANGVIAASAGNHAQGVAWGSQKQKVNALIVMPKNAPLMKIQNTKALGAEVLLEGDNYDESFCIAKKLANKTGRIFIHAFEDPQVIAGQGTVGLEILEQLPDVDYIVGSIGGGGLMAGVSIALKELRPITKLIGCQSSGSPSMIQAIQKRAAVKLKKASTFADGIAVRNSSEKMRKILQPRLDYLLETDDEAIASAILTLIEKAKTVSEGAGAVSLAVLDQIKAEIKNKKVVLIISGGNIDVNVLSRVIDRGLIRAGRRIRVNVWLSDTPGSLARLTELIARNGANILQAIHDRNEPSTTIELTEVALTLETKGPEHTARLMAEMKRQVNRIELVY